MRIVRRFETSWFAKLSVFGAVLAVAACGSAPTPKVALNSTVQSMTFSPEKIAKYNGPTSGPEYFSAAAYGVSASPRVATGPRLKRGGGYNKVGSSYVVRGKRYHPTENQPRSQTGMASWYGKAFHGRLTANGEVFDMNHLTAAHKTMPLPSYARVTNLKNGRSLIVRVNDRGPFSNNRVIDLSKRAAEALDYTLSGTAKVKVEYVGRAPLHGQDDEFLLASIKGAPGFPGRAPGTLLASDRSGPTPQQVFSGLSAFPVVPDRPKQDVGTLVSAYADWRIDRAFGSQDGNSNWKSAGR